MSALELAIAELRDAPESIARETLDFIVFLKRRTACQASPQADSMGYPVGYFERTAGSFADQPLQRPEQAPLSPATIW
jgi:hypothetical protein